MKITLLRVFSLLLLLQLQAAAELKLFNFKDKRVSIDGPNDWQIAEYLFNSPITYLGPFKDGRRPIITFNPTTVESFVFNKEKLKKEQMIYQDGRKKWLDKNHAKLKAFIPYSSTQWLNVGEVHTVGVEYEMMNQHFYEVEYFFNCKNELSNFHVLMTKEQKQEYEAQINLIIRSIKCLDLN